MLWTVDRGGKPSRESYRHGQSVRSTKKIAFIAVRMSFVRGKPPGLAAGISRAEPILRRSDCSGTQVCSADRPPGAHPCTLPLTMQPLRLMVNHPALSRASAFESGSQSMCTSPLLGRETSPTPAGQDVNRIKQPTLADETIARFRSPGSSTLTKEVSLPRRCTPACYQIPGSATRWTYAGGGWTTRSSNGCGAAWTTNSRAARLIGTPRKRTISAGGVW